jgi:hypothetical protein
LVTPVDALRILEAQHGWTRRLLLELDESKGDERRQALGELCELLATHALLEERHFLPALEAFDETGAWVRDAHFGLREIRRVLFDLCAADVDDELFDAKLALLDEKVADHCAAWEASLEPAAKNLLSAGEFLVLGRAMLATMVARLGRRPPGLPGEADALGPTSSDD